MPSPIVHPVVTRRQRKQFLGFPWSLYREDPNWVPPLRMDQKEMVGYGHHPFFEDKNEIQTFLAYRENGEICGRIAAIHDQGHIDHHNERRGFVGFFESVDDQQVADALFDAARAWLAERDLHCMRGPMNPGLNYALGILAEGFDSPPTFLMPYNPAYYERLFAGYGFRKAQDLFAYWGNIEMLPASTAKHGPIADKIIEHFDIRVRPMDKSRFREEVEMFLSIYNRSMSRHWGFVPMSPSEIRHMAGGLRHLIVPEMALAAEIDGKVVGATFCLPDYNPRIKKIDGRLFPFGFLHLLRNRQAIKKIRILAANVLPEYQLMGVGLVLLRALVPMALDWGIEEAEFSWVAESNSLSRGALEKANAQRIKTYRVYDWDPATDG